VVIVVSFHDKKEAAMPAPASRLSRVVVTGPLAPFAGNYRRELRRRGYTPRSAVNELRQAARLSRWLEDRGFAGARLNRERVEEFLAFQRAGGRHRSEWSRPGLWCMLDVLEEIGELERGERASVASPAETLLASFETRRGRHNANVGIIVIRPISA
jgi:hypothetical protein